MALVQKLTGLSKSDNNNDGAAADPPPQPKPEPSAAAEKKVCANEENETSSVITEENNCSSSVGDTTQVNSCFLNNPATMMDPPPPALNPYMAANLPVFTTPPANSADLFCSSNQPFLNYDSLLFSHNMRTSMNNPSATTLEGMNDFRDF